MAFPLIFQGHPISQVLESQPCSVYAVSKARPEGRFENKIQKERRCNFLFLKMVYICSRPAAFYGSPGVAPNLPFPSHSNGLMASQASNFFLNRSFLSPFSDIVSRASSPQGER